MVLYKHHSVYKQELHSSGDEEEEGPVTSDAANNVAHKRLIPLRLSVAHCFEF